MSAVTTGSSLRTSLEQISLSGNGYDVDEESFANVLSSQMGISSKEASTLINIAQEALGGSPEPEGLIEYILQMLQVDGNSNEQVNTDAAMNSDITDAVMGALQGLAPNGKFDAENSTDVQNLIDITGLPEEDVRQLIDDTGGDVTALMILLFDYDGDQRVTVSELDKNDDQSYADAMTELMTQDMERQTAAITNATSSVQSAADGVKGLAEGMKSDAITPR